MSFWISRSISLSLRIKFGNILGGCINCALDGQDISESWQRLNWLPVFNHLTSLTTLMMMMQNSFEQIWVELHHLHNHIQLRLPAPLHVLQQQRSHLDQIQHRLETLQVEVASRLGSSITASTYLTYLTLMQLVQSMIQDVVSLKHLAAEYPIDPEGTTACLRSRPQHPSVLTRLNPSYETHKQFLTHWLKKNSPPHKNSATLASPKCER